MGKGVQAPESLPFPASTGRTQGGRRAWRREPGRPLGAQCREVGTEAASVLGDFAVVFRMDMPAQADGQEHPQDLLRERVRIRGGRAAQSP